MFLSLDWVKLSKLGENHTHTFGGWGFIKIYTILGGDSLKVIWWETFKVIWEELSDWGHLVRLGETLTLGVFQGHSGMISRSSRQVSQCSHNLGGRLSHMSSGKVSRLTLGKVSDWGTLSDCVKLTLLQIWGMGGISSSHNRGQG